MAYEAIGDTRTFLEAAAARGFEHVSSSTLDIIVSDLRIQTGVKVRHHKAMHIIDAMQSTWGWSRVDVARALMRVLPETRGSKARPKCPEQKPEKNFVWDDIPSIAAAVKARETGLPEVTRVPCKPEVESGILVQALCVIDQRRGLAEVQ